MQTNKTLLAALAVTTLTLLLHSIPNAVPAEVLMTMRWVNVAALGFFGFQRKSLTVWILVAMVVGLTVGYDFPKFGSNLDVLSKVFIQLIKTVIAPLLFGTLVVAIAGQSDSKQVGSMSVKAFTYFFAATSIALLVGLLAINFTRAGELPEEVKAKGRDVKTVVAGPDDISFRLDSLKGGFQYKVEYQGKIIQAVQSKPKPDWKQSIYDIFPVNVAKMIYDGAVLQIVVFSLLFGFGLRQVSERHRRTMIDWLESLTEVMFKFTGIIMNIAPFAVGGAMAYTIGTMGFGAVGNLIKLLLTLYGALFVFVLLVFVPLLFFMRIPIKRFFNAIYEPASLAFATASSEAALPKALTAMERFGVPRKIVSFVLPTGYSFNLDGSTLYLSLASVFCAQAAGIHLSWQTQLAMMATLLLTSKGVAAVPGASLIILTATLQQFEIPEWPIALIFGVDRLMDMVRTSVNLMGNCLASVVVARWEGEMGDVED
jgi:proton glutamate symport protein